VCPSGGPMLSREFRNLDNSHNLRSLDSIYDELVVGNWVLWVAVEEDELLGAAVTEVLTTERGLYCNVPFAWSKDPKKNKEYLQRFSGLRGNQC
jgi:hypothetical protein